MGRKLISPVDITWIAHYSNGDKLSQADGAKYQEIDRDRLVAFDLWGNRRLLLRLDLRDDGLPTKRLIWRIRSQFHSDGRQERIHLVGWKRAINGYEVQTMAYVFEDGTVLVGGQPIEQDYLGDVVLHDFERE